MGTDTHAGAKLCGRHRVWDLPSRFNPKPGDLPHHHHFRCQYFHFQYPNKSFHYHCFHYHCFHYDHYHYFIQGKSECHHLVTCSLPCFLSQSCFLTFTFITVTWTLTFIILTLTFTVITFTFTMIRANLNATPSQRSTSHSTLWEPSLPSGDQFSLLALTALQRQTAKKKNCPNFRIQLVTDGCARNLLCHYHHHPARPWDLLACFIIVWFSSYTSLL